YRVNLRLRRDAVRVVLGRVDLDVDVYLAGLSGVGVDVDDVARLLAPCPVIGVGASLRPPLESADDAGAVRVGRLCVGPRRHDAVDDDGSLYAGDGRGERGLGSDLERARDAGACIAVRVRRRNGADLHRGSIERYRCRGEVND